MLYLVDLLAMMSSTCINQENVPKNTICPKTKIDEQIPPKSCKSPFPRVQNSPKFKVTIAQTPRVSIASSQSHNSPTPSVTMAQSPRHTAAQSPRDTVAQSPRYAVAQALGNRRLLFLGNLLQLSTNDSYLSSSSSSSPGRQTKCNS